MTETKIGSVTHYYNHLHVAGVVITDGELHKGDTIHIPAPTRGEAHAGYGRSRCTTVVLPKQLSTGIEYHHATCDAE